MARPDDGDDDMNEIVALLARRARMTAAERADADAMAAEAPWPEALGQRLVAVARSAARGRITGAVVLTIRALGKRLEALVDGGRLHGPAFLRGGTPNTGGGLLVTFPLSSGTATAHVDDAEDDRFVVMLDLVGIAPVGARLSVDREGRELASEIWTGGRWLLPRLQAGSYQIQLSGHDGSPIALDLVLERQED